MLQICREEKAMIAGMHRERLLKELYKQLAQHRECEAFHS